MCVAVTVFAFHDFLDDSRAADFLKSIDLLGNFGIGNRRRLPGRGRTKGGPKHCVASFNFHRKPLLPCLTDDSLALMDSSLCLLEDKLRSKVLLGENGFLEERGRGGPNHCVASFIFQSELLLPCLIDDA